MAIVFAGSDLAKNPFAVHGVIEAGRPALGHTVRLMTPMFVTRCRLSGKGG